MQISKIVHTSKMHKEPAADHLHAAGQKADSITAT